MKVLVYGQERVWVKKLQRLLESNGVDLCEAVSEDIRLVITNFPIEEERKGILSKVPFLVVSKEKREEKILEAFREGAEDYMIYPVSPKIACARILRILKKERSQTGELQKLQEQIHFTPNEYRILSFLMSYPGKAFSRNELLEGVFPDNYEGYDRNVDNYVKQIRKKLAAESGKKEWIETVHGVGYRFTAKEE